MITAHDAMNNAMGTAKAAIGSATDVVKTVAGTTKSTALDTAKSVVEFVTFLRGIGLDDVLGLVGLARRKSALPTLFAFGGGVAVGASIGLLIAPVSGKDARRYIGMRVGELFGRATEKAEQVQEKAGEVVNQVQEKAGEVAGRVQDKVERVQDKAGQVVGQVQEKAGEVVGRVQEKAGELTGQAQGESEGEDQEDGRKNRRGRQNHSTHMS